MRLNAGGDGKENTKGYRGYFGIGAEDLDNEDGTRDLAREDRHGLKKKMLKGDFKEGFDVGLEKQDMNVGRRCQCMPCILWEKCVA